MPIPLSADYDAARLRAAARGSKDANQTRRLLTLATIYDGATRTEAAAIGGVTLQIVRDWVVSPSRCLAASCAAGATAGSRRSPAAMPRPTAPSRLLKKSPRAFGRDRARRGCRRPRVEVCFADEARIGQKNKITRRWAKRGTRPSAPQDQRTVSTYIFSAICSATGSTAGLVLPWCNTEGMGLHLAEVTKRVTPGNHCVLLVDQAEWHIWERLIVPSTITIVPLPAKCPELNPVENVWQFMRGNWLSNRVFASYTAIVDHYCDAWNRLADQPWRVMSIGLREWAAGQGR